MNKSLKKILVSGASLLMLASVGAMASNVVNPAHASRITRLEAKRSQDYKNINNINKELSKLEHKHIHHHAKKHVARKARKHAVKKYRHHESIGNWYYHHAVKLWNKYDQAGKDDNGSSIYNTGSNDETGWNNDTNYYLNSRHMNNPYYRDGWIITYANQSTANKPSASNGGTRSEYKKADNIYNNGVRYAKSIHTHSGVQYNPDTNAWNRPSND